MKRGFSCRLTGSLFREGEHRVIAVPTTLYLKLKIYLSETKLMVIEPDIQLFPTFGQIALEYL